MACPACHHRLARTADGFKCTGCGRAFQLVDGIPAFVDLAAAAHDELDHLAGNHGHPTGPDPHKVEQSRYFDRVALTEFEIERPAGTPAWYQFLIDEKVRRSLAPFGGRLDGRTALTVCGGSGMDAEYLARAGAWVIASDLSLGAARRVAERARRHEVHIVPVVADVEHLPFQDQSIDLVFVHDGLHHLADPLAGLAEMTRVARHFVCVTEPAQATVTSLAVHLGLAVAREEAGNLVARLRPREVQAALEQAGLRVLRAERYAMYYGHTPGRWSRLLSRRPMIDAAMLGWRAANWLVGRFGNKLVVVAARDQPADSVT